MIGAGTGLLHFVRQVFGTLGMNPGTPLLTTELNLTLAVM